MDHTPTHWQHRNRPPRLERRLDFSDYERTRDFLEALAQASEDSGVYPDISFGRTYVNITLHADADAGGSDPRRAAFAARIDSLLAPIGPSDGAASHEETRYEPRH